MPFEFVARNGIIGLANSTISGSLAVSQSVTAQSFTGSITGSATHAFTASFAVTSSYADNFFVSGTLTAQRIVVQTISSSISYASGSNRFGSLLTDTQIFTGSVGITGSLSTNGDQTLSGSLNIVPTSGNKGIVVTVNAGNNGFIQQGLAGGFTFTIDGANGGGPRLGLGDSPSAGYNYFQIGAFNSENNFDTVGRNFSIRSTISATNDTRFKLFYNTGNVLIQNGGTFTDAGFRLDVSGTTRLNGATTISASVDRMLSIGNGINDASVYVSAAGGVDIKAFNAGGDGFLYISNSKLRISPVNGDSFFSSSLTIGTFTNAGFRLDVLGSTRLNGNTTVT
jgi:hypothetical protein